MLVNFNDESFSYDEHGNITNYRNQTCKFDKFHKLEQIGENSFTYDAFGCRSKKNKIYYIYDGQGNLCKEEGEHEIFYHYEGDKVHSIQVDGNDYLLRRNIFGDVTHIYDTSGELCAMYRYDAWGNHKVYDELGNENIDIDFIGNINPIRYRGYYFDKETALFYCNYRYYDPKVGRWISSDSIDYLNPESINGLNLYCYCMNNPIMYADPSGNLPFFILTAIIGAVIGVGITAAVDYIPDKKFNLHWGWYVGAGVLGAVIGAGIGMAVSYYATGSIASSTGKVFSGLFGKTAFYRTMSADDYATLQTSGKLPAGTETFISPSSSYASTYDGVTVKFTVRNRTVNWLTKIGVKDKSTLVGSMYPSMPMVSKGWMAKNAFFKAEQGIINIGLGYGKALDIFNKGIIIVGLI